MREENLAGIIEVAQNLRVERVALRFVELRRRATKADDRERMRRHDFPVRLRAHPGRELRSERNVPAELLADAMRAEMTQDEPEFERPKTPPQLQTIIHIVDDAGLGRRKILGHEAERAADDGLVLQEEHRKIH